MIKVAILGYGNIGRAAEQAVKSAPDMELAGVFHHNDCLDCMDADVVLLCTPTREVPKFAAVMLAKGICTVDSFDIHGQIAGLRSQLTPLCVTNKTVSVLSAGWDPGSDSVVRALLMAMAPKGITYTNFGPGRSMGHSVAAKSIDGVKNALSMTIPLGTGVHRRMVYIELEDGADFKTVEAAILADDYFAHDETHVIPVESVDALNNVAHGVNLVRSGVSGETHNQRFEFNMEINNPALTGQVMVSCARAAVRMRDRGEYGAKTMIEIRPIDLLPGDEESLVKALV
ncbi:MAG: diaminopimelate dehydrogenase [Paludibacteraceae bacterium]|nr:diaminopimelate dehydrogenase [Paludibacteraceae bacterium]MBQ2189468.1 diaminopimelate dehydrogenase [Paludibacteraceae bacterium]MBQ2520206.1 diaminopimelate dehydrogenase [Paludibacteraceae bacterium]MBQ4018632.1 diaminopimelate dehydrogenase [Paludibacteraceae bacterium]MBQ5379012.1 diaminopimelate dehydrogenase [Paludibacteraceae bacterium]